MPERKEDWMKLKTFAVLGLGKYGKGVADELMNRGAEVLVVDRDEELIRQYAGRYTQAVAADLTDVNAIRELGLGSMDAVIVTMAQNLEACIMCVMIAKESGVRTVIVKAETPRKGEILQRIGADRVVFPERESGIRTAFRLMSHDVIQFFDLSSELFFVEMVPKDAWVGHTLAELNLRSRHGINVIAARRGLSVEIVNDPSTVVKKDEPLLIVVEKKALEALDI